MDAPAEVADLKLLLAFCAQRSELSTRPDLRGDPVTGIALRLAEVASVLAAINAGPAEHFCRAPCVNAHFVRPHCVDG